jgi:hypothetical protein
VAAGALASARADAEKRVAEIEANACFDLATAAQDNDASLKVLAAKLAGYAAATEECVLSGQRRELKTEATAHLTAQRQAQTARPAAAAAAAAFEASFAASAAFDEPHPTCL